MRVVAVFPVMVIFIGCGVDLTDRGSGDAVQETSTPTDSRSLESGSEADWFVERAEEVGLDFRHFNGMSGEFYFPEIIPPGVGLVDVDNDGDLDAYLAQGQLLGSEKVLSDALFPPVDPTPLAGRLYRNDLAVQADGTRTLGFTDITDESQLEARGYGMGVAIGDVNNDGWNDLYLTNLSSNQLFRNNGDGTFNDVSQESGLDDPAWSVSAAFVDYDLDGWLDLYVGNYVDYSADAEQQCPSVTGGLGYCLPQAYRAQPDRLYRNLGNGTFVDVTARALLGRTFGPALGVSTADFNGDGWPDIYVANDGEENQLWLNQQDGTLVNVGLLSGTALNGDGKAEGSMGVDAGDVDNDGDEDLFMTHLTGETNTLYINDGTGLFEDRSTLSGLGSASLALTGFGTAWLDFDNDGWLDVLTVNGRVSSAEERTNEPFPYDQRKQLFRNLGDGQFQEVTDQAGSAFGVSKVGRGAAFGDVDNDGDIDVLVGNDSGRVELLINQVDSRRNHWLGLRLLGKETPRDMFGARVEVERSDGVTVRRRVRADGSYGSANDPRVLVGLGNDLAAPLIRVYWPTGNVEEWRDVASGQWMTLVEGEGQ